MRDCKHLSIRTEEELHDKLQYIAAYEGRSLNGQLVVLIQQCVRAFEREHGTIDGRQLKTWKKEK